MFFLQNTFQKMSKIPRKFIPANMNGSKQELSEISVDGIRLINYIIEKRTCKLLVHVLAKIYQKKKQKRIRCLEKKIILTKISV